VEGITRITGYFTKISSWNKGKLGELRDRHRSGEYFTAAATAGATSLTA
jgi:ribonucleoside-triphosphate reductase